MQKLYDALVLQNEEIRRTQNEVERAHAKYADLYEFAPTSHLTVDKDGLIRDVNVAGTHLLGRGRHAILSRPFLAFLEPESRRVYRQFQVRLQESNGSETCEITLRTDKGLIVAMLKGAVIQSDPRCIRLALTDISELRRTMDQLTQSHAQLRDLAARLQSVREEECTRIAREIHDELGQALTGLRLDVGWLREQLADSNPAVLDKLAAMTKLIDATTQSVRDVATDLRPVVLDQLGLLPAIEWGAREFEARTGTPCKLNFFLRQVRLDRDRGTALFRIFQEIMTNIARHARASTVTITVQERAGLLILEIADNGRGITQSELSNPRALGLLGMRQRAALLGGQTTVVGSPDKGTTVTVTMPFPEPDRETV